MAALMPHYNLLEVWQNLAPFGSRPIDSTIEALLTKVVNWRSSVLLIVEYFVSPHHAAVGALP
jgi:hypothetical protein